MVRGLPKTKLESKYLCSACAKGKQTKSSFKPKGIVSTTKPLVMLHRDLCGPMCMVSGGGKRYILVIVDDYEF